MKLFSIVLVGLIILSAIMLPQIFFSVSETEVGIVTRFGQIKSEITSPGLRMKTPFMDQVTTFEKRLLLFDAPPDSLLTRDKKTSHYRRVCPRTNNRPKDFQGKAW